MITQPAVMLQVMMDDSRNAMKSCVYCFTGVSLLCSVHEAQSCVLWKSLHSCLGIVRVVGLLSVSWRGSFYDIILDDEEDEWAHVPAQGDDSAQGSSGRDDFMGFTFLRHSSFQDISQEQPGMVNLCSLSWISCLLSTVMLLVLYMSTFTCRIVATLGCFWHLISVPCLLVCV